MSLLAILHFFISRVASPFCRFPLGPARYFEPQKYSPLVSTVIHINFIPHYDYMKTEVHIFLVVFKIILPKTHFCYTSHIKQNRTFGNFFHFFVFHYAQYYFNCAFMYWSCCNIQLVHCIYKTKSKLDHTKIKSH